jgi:hypothetical protein
VVPQKKHRQHQALQDLEAGENGVALQRLEQYINVCMECFCEKIQHVMWQETDPGPVELRR